MQTSFNFPGFHSKSPSIKFNSIAEIELRYKPKVRPSSMPKVSSSLDAFNIFMQSWDKEKLDFIEQFKILLVNRANKVVGSITISSGSSTGTVADPKLIIGAALKANSMGLLICHNHPSGSLQPSKADIDLTKKIKQAANFLDLQLLDHLIVTGDNKYYSFADEGIL